jgi:protease-4
MKKRPFLMALLLLGAIFLFFLVVIFSISTFLGGSSSLAIGEKVGVIEISGVITSSKSTIEHLLDFRKDDSIKAVVLRVDSPGGGVGPSQEIYEEVEKTVKIKPVVVSMGSVAASGGYYISSPANRIFANAGTITGSIGVILEFTNFQELLKKIGLKSQVIKSGEHKDIGSPVRPMTEEDREILQSLIDDVHQQFIAAVAKGRKLDPKKVAVLADGRIFSGQQALSFGLVDQLGDLQDAIQAAAGLAGIKGEPKVVYPPREKPGILQYLVEESVTRFRKGLQESTTTGLRFLWSGVNQEVTYDEK